MLCKHHVGNVGNELRVCYNLQTSHLNHGHEIEFSPKKIVYTCWIFRISNLLTQFPCDSCLATIFHLYLYFISIITTTCSRWVKVAACFGWKKSQAMPKRPPFLWICSESKVESLSWQRKLISFCWKPNGPPACSVRLLTEDWTVAI